MSDEHLREVVGNFLYELENISAHEQKTLRACKISEAVDQFGYVTCLDSCMSLLPGETPKWQICLWMAENLTENIVECRLMLYVSHILCNSMRCFRFLSTC